MARALTVAPLLALSVLSATLAAVPKPVPVPMRSWGHGNTPTALMYTIDDLGAPPASTYNYNYPLALNNSGQIAGIASPTATNTWDCVVYNNGKFVDYTLGTLDSNCFPGALSSADSKGVIRVVGNLNTAYDVGNVAFFGTLTTSTNAATMSTYTTVNSWLYGVNLSGEAVGDGTYDPIGAYYAGDMFVVPTGQTTLVVGQPQCTTTNHLCAYIQPGNTDSGVCPFGGCAINDSGTILGLDAQTQYLMTYTYGTATSGKDLIADPGGYIGSAQINNAGQILYSTYDPTTQTYETYVYSIAGGKTTAIPALSGCTGGGYGLSINNKGQVLGEDFNGACSSTYWTWSATTGTVNLNNEIPTTTKYSQITPIGINDSGQILVGLGETSKTDWGILDPPSAAARTMQRRAAGTRGLVH